MRFPIPAAGSAVSGFDLALYHHTLGAANDVVAFGQDYSRIAEYQMTASDDGRAAVLVGKGDSGPREAWVRDAPQWRRVVGDSADATFIAYAGSRLLAIATRGTPHGRVMSIDDAGHASTVLGERPWALESVAPIDGGMLVLEDSGPRWRVEHVRDDGSVMRVVALPHENIGITDVASSASSSDAVIGWGGWTTPPKWQRYDGRSGALATIYEIPTAADFSGVVASETDAISKDGTHVPVTVLALRTTPRDGTAPAILGGYGGFPSVRRRNWLLTSSAFGTFDVENGQGDQRAPRSAPARRLSRINALQAPRSTADSLPSPGTDHTRVASPPR